MLCHRAPCGQAARPLQSAQRPCARQHAQRELRAPRPARAFGLDLSGLPPPDPAATQQAVYVALGATLVSFALTFGVAPRFRSAFKEEDTWRDMYRELVAMGGVQTITPAQAAAQARKGAVLMDIRLARAFEQGAMADSVNFPLYQPIAGWGLASNIRRAGFAFFGIYGTERNKEWLAQVEAAVAKNKEIIVACEMGGSMKAKPGAERGFQSRSLKAVYYLKKAGYRNVKHMEGGIDEYKRSVRSLEQRESEEQAPRDARQPELV